MIRIQQRKRQSPEIGIAPLVDCVFLLLVFFLLTSSFSERLGIKISLPGSDTARAAERETLDVAVSESGEITFKGSPIRAEELSAALKNAVAEEGKKSVFLLTDRAVSMGLAAEVIDCVRAAGIENIAIATQRKESSDTVREAE